MNYSQLDTIAALATPPGIGALAIIRLSGQESLKIAGEIFNGRDGVTSRNPGRFYGEIIKENNGKDGAERRLDEVVLHSFIAPHSFTGEDMVEINCHGGALVVERILALLLRKGARLAAPGEFSKRAFLNGKIDLVQAEAIADVISSQSSKGLELSLAHLHGDLSQKISRMGAMIRQSCALLELELDFSEDIQFADRAQLDNLMNVLARELEEIVSSYHYGRLLRDGARVVIAGKPNVGKSTLMNRLLRSERAIVSAFPGTTRDSLEEGIRIDGRFFRLIDTAGIRLSFDEIEREGVSRSKAWMEKADILLLVFDASEPLDSLDREVLSFAATVKQAQRIFVHNKIDLATTPGQYDLPIDMPYDQIAALSCKTEIGLDDLQRKLVKCVENRAPKEESAILTRLRHYNALQRAQNHLQHARSSLDSAHSAEFIALDLRMALSAVGEVVGEVSSEEILNDIFSSFCIGK